MKGRVFVFPGSRSSIYIHQYRPLVCFYQPWHSICVCLFFVLQLKFLIVTVCIYLNSALLICIYYLSIMWEIISIVRNFFTRDICNVLYFLYFVPRLFKTCFKWIFIFFNLIQLISLFFSFAWFDLQLSVVVSLLHPIPISHITNLGRGPVKTNRSQGWGAEPGAGEHKYPRKA